MKRIRKMLIMLSTFLIVVSFLVVPIHAWSDMGYYYYSGISQMEGSWNTSTERATEELNGLAYLCQIIFQYTSVDLTADVYKIQIDYDGVDSGYPWNYESLYLQYRWGTSGIWIWISTLDINTYDGFITIADATSTTCQVRLIDTSRTIDGLQHTWFFGNEPILWVYWY